MRAWELMEASGLLDSNKIDKIYKDDKGVAYKFRKAEKVNLNEPVDPTNTAQDQQGQYTIDPLINLKRTLKLPDNTRYEYLDNADEKIQSGKGKIAYYAVLDPVDPKSNTLVLIGTKNMFNKDLTAKFNLTLNTASGPKETIGVKPSQLGLVGSVYTSLSEIAEVIRNIPEAKCPIKDALASAVEQCKGDKIIVVGGKPYASAIRDYFGEVLAPCMLMGRSSKVKFPPAVSPHRVINGIKTLQPFMYDDPLATMSPAAAIVTGIKFPDNSEKLVDSYVYYSGKKIDYTGTDEGGNYFRISSKGGESGKGAAASISTINMLYEKLLDTKNISGDEAATKISELILRNIREDDTVNKLAITPDAIKDIVEVIQLASKKPETDNTHKITSKSIYSVLLLAKKFEVYPDDVLDSVIRIMQLTTKDSPLGVVPEGLTPGDVTNLAKLATPKAKAIYGYQCLQVVAKAVAAALNDMPALPQFVSYVRKCGDYFTASIAISITGEDVVIESCTLLYPGGQSGTVGSGKHYTGKGVKGGLTVEDQSE